MITDLAVFFNSVANGIIAKLYGRRICEIVNIYKEQMV